MKRPDRASSSRPTPDPDDRIEIRIEVPPDRDGWRLDRFLCWKVPRLTRTRAQRIIREQASTLAGRPLRPNHIVRAGERFRILRPIPKEPEHPEEFGVLFEDEHLFVVDKPAGLAVHPTARYLRGTLTALLRERFGSRPPRITHRLDRETSGVLVCARTPDAERSIKRQFEDRLIHKDYLAVVHGEPRWDDTVVDVPLRPAGGGKLRVRMEVAPTGSGLDARTHFRVLERVSGASLVLASPETGRQHQIRVHLSSLGHAVVGDKLYAHDEALFLAFYEGGMTDELLAVYGLPRQALHSHRVRLTHPSTGEPLTVESALPSDLLGYLAARR